MIIDLLAPFTDIFVLSFSRPFGLIMTFVIFTWYKINSGILRIGTAISIGLPVFSLASPEAFSLLESSELPVFLLFIKELVIGAMIGWIVSLPLIIASSAGAIIDTYRGSFQGSPDPTGGQITAVGNLFMLTSMGLFASMGGLWIVIDILYQSYAIWPVYSPMPNANSGLGVFLSLFSNLIKAAFILAAPIVTVMFISDMTFLIAAKLGKKINVTFLAFSTKSLIVVSLLPIYIFVFVRVQKINFEQFDTMSNFLRSLLQ